jgi:TATA-box binding protein (TBP) (component of TFIID and TFIIIB)
MAAEGDVVKAASLLPYRVSTITAVGGVGSALDIRAVFDQIRVDRSPDFSGDRVLCARLGDETRGDDDCDRASRRRRTPKTATQFGNQVTLVLSVGGTRANLKAFSNGRVQLTGVKSVGLGLDAVGLVVRELRVCPGAAADVTALRVDDYRVCLINSDFDLGFEVKRDLLHRCLKKHFPETLCSYEPCIYQGLKIKFMWNDSPDAKSSETGVCECGGDRPCLGRGRGHARGDCRKVTVAVFQSGKVIITGAHTNEQIADAHRFLVGRLAAEHAAEFTRVNPKAAP